MAIFLEEIVVVCKNCGISKTIKTNTNEVMRMEYCSDACNEEHFLNIGGGLVPKKFRGNYIISKKCGKAKLKTEENGIS